MKHFIKLVLLTLGFGLFAAVLPSLPSHHAAAEGDPTDNPALSAFDIAGQCSFNGFTNCSSGPILTVPTATIAVIESVSFSCTILPSTVGNFAIIEFLSPAGRPASVFLNTPAGVPYGLSGLNIVSAAQNIKAYAGPPTSTSNSQINLGVHTSGDETGNTQCQFNLAGYFVSQR